MIEYGINIDDHIECLPDTLYVEKIEYGEKTLKNGFIIPAETMDYLGNFVRPRWAKILYKADNIKNVNVGDYILLSHGRWSSSIKCTIKGIQKTIWYISPKSYKEGALAVSHKMPECLKQYGITDD